MNETHFSRRRGIRASVAYAVSAVGATAVLFAVSCTTEGKPLLIGDDQPNPPSFTPVPEGGADAEAGLISYCPSSQCPPGWTTCPDSRFPCDTNVLADIRNCGGCGMACPPRAGDQLFTCNEGACTLECDATIGYKNCDGLVDNGCESFPLDPANCGACGVACAVGEGCLLQDDELTEVGCGCPSGKVDCTGTCKELSSDDASCGTCYNRCDKTGGPDAPQYPNMYYGCAGGECGKLKCQPGFANCDGKLENGCETSTLTDDNCGACDNKCLAGKRCASVPAGERPSCVCDSGLTFCQTGRQPNGLPTGSCEDLRSSRRHCGACGVNCESTPGSGINEVPVCDFGKCVRDCIDGFADCNGSQVDGCEIDTKSDPRNCGGCGITCDLTLGQACVAGKCVVEPCDQADAGEVTR